MSEIPAFKPGDKVQMKTGGPQMAVTRVDGDSIECMWMQQKGKTAAYDQKTGTFPAVVLIPYKPRAAMSVATFRRGY